MMNLWYGILLLPVGHIITIILRVPFDKKSQETMVAESRNGKLEKFLLARMGSGIIILPIVFIVTRLLSFANYELRPTAFVVGGICDGLEIWLSRRKEANA